MVRRPKRNRAEVPTAPDDQVFLYALDLRRTFDAERERRSELEQALADYRELVERRETFIYLLEHELRTPLTTVLGYLELLEGGALGDLDPLPSRAVAASSDAARRLREVLAKLEGYSDAEVAYSAVPRSARSDLASRLAAALAPVRARALERGQAFDLDCEWVPERAALDLDRVLQIARELAENAVKFGRPAGRTVVRAGLSPGELWLDVADDGPGLPAERREQLFEPFTVGGHLTTRPAGGLGLGLAIVVRAAAALDASLSVDSPPGGGTRIAVRIPLASVRAAAGDEQLIRALEDVRELYRRERQQRYDLERAQHALAGAQEQAELYARDLRTAYDQAVSRAAELGRAYLETVGALAAAVETRDSYTGGHVERVRSWSVAVGRVLGWSEDELRQLEYGALLHDIGKLGVPDRVLRKPGPLDPAEWALMRQHPAIGARLMRSAEFLERAAACAEAHHERFDGSGYPAGLAGEAIPIMARIVTVADAFDAMTTNRPYRAALSEQAALAELRRGAGTQFDPMIVEAFIQVWSQAYEP